jgi:CDP-glycerol glycerophosphotransferase (TagB/SpsB family)
MSHGIYTTWEPIVEFCQKEKIDFVCYDRAKTKNHINININQNSPNWDFTTAWDRYKEKTLNEIENNQVDTYLKERELQKGDVYSYNFSKVEANISSLKNRLGINKDRIIITIFTNLIWDAANVSRDVAFKNPLECITKTIEYFKDNDKVQIVIRSHPAEKVLGTKEKYSDLVLDYFKNNLPDNVTIIQPEDNVNSFSVIELSDIGIVNTSTVGLEFAILGKPILLISETNYRNKGFTFDVENEDEYFSTLDNQIKNIQLKENQVDLARKYFYMMMFLYQKKTPVNYENGIFVGYEYNSLDEIMNDSTMQNIINTIENTDLKTDFIEWTNT